MEHLEVRYSPRYYKFNDGNIILDNQNSGMSESSLKFVYKQDTHEYQQEGQYAPIKLLSYIPFTLYYDDGNNGFYNLKRGVVSVEVVTAFVEKLKTEIETFYAYLNNPLDIANLNPLDIEQLKEQLESREEYVRLLQDEINEINREIMLAAALNWNDNPNLTPNSIEIDGKNICYDKKRGIFYYNNVGEGLPIGELNIKDVVKIRDNEQVQIKFDDEVDLTGVIQDNINIIKKQVDEVEVDVEPSLRKQMKKNIEEAKSVILLPDDIDDIDDIQENIVYISGKNIDVLPNILILLEKIINKIDEIGIFTSFIPELKSFKLRLITTEFDINQEEKEEILINLQSFLNELLSKMKYLDLLNTYNDANFDTLNVLIKKFQATSNLHKSIYSFDKISSLVNIICNDTKNQYILMQCVLIITRSDQMDELSKFKLILKNFALYNNDQNYSEDDLFIPTGIDVDIPVIEPILQSIEPVLQSVEAIKNELNKKKANIRDNANANGNPQDIVDRTSVKYNWLTEKLQDYYSKKTMMLKEEIREVDENKNILGDEAEQTALFIAREKFSLIIEDKIPTSDIKGIQVAIYFIVTNLIDTIAEVGVQDPINIMEEFGIHNLNYATDHDLEVKVKVKDFMANFFKKLENPHEIYIKQNVFKELLELFNKSEQLPLLLKYNCENPEDKNIVLLVESQEIPLYENADLPDFNTNFIYDVQTGIWPEFPLGFGIEPIQVESAAEQIYPLKIDLGIIPSKLSKVEGPNSPTGVASQLSFPFTPSPVSVKEIGAPRKLPRLGDPLDNPLDNPLRAGGQKGGKVFPFSKSYLSYLQVALIGAFNNTTNVQFRYKIIMVIIQILLYSDSIHDFGTELDKPIIESISEAFDHLYNTINKTISGAPDSYYNLRKAFESLPGVGPDIQEMLQNYKANAFHEWGGYEAVMAYRYKQDIGLSEMTILKYIYINPNNLNDKKNFFSSDDLAKLGNEEYIFRSPSSAPSDPKDAKYKHKDEATNQWYSYFVLMNIDGSPVKPLLSVDDLDLMRAYSDNPISKDILAVLFGLVPMIVGNDHNIDFNFITISKENETLMKIYMDRITNIYIPGLADPSTTSESVLYNKLLNNTGLRPPNSPFPDNETIKNPLIPLSPLNVTEDHPNSLMALSMQTFLDLYANSENENDRVKITKFAPILTPDQSEYSGIYITISKAAAAAAAAAVSTVYELKLKDTNISNIKKLVDKIFVLNPNIFTNQLRHDTFQQQYAGDPSHERIIKLSVMYYNNMMNKYKSTDPALNKKIFLSCILMWKAFGDYWEITYVYGLDYLKNDDNNKYFITSTDKNVALMMMWLGVYGIIAKTSVHLPAVFVTTANTKDTTEEISLLNEDNENFIIKQMGEGMLTNLFPKEKDGLYNIKSARTNIIEIARKASIIEIARKASIIEEEGNPLGLAIMEEEVVESAIQILNRKILEDPSQFDIDMEEIIKTNYKNAYDFVVNNYLSGEDNAFGSAITNQNIIVSWRTKIEADNARLLEKLNGVAGLTQRFDEQTGRVQIAMTNDELLKEVADELSEKIYDASFFIKLINVLTIINSTLTAKTVSLNQEIINLDQKLDDLNINVDENEKEIISLEKEKQNIEEDAQKTTKKLDSVINFLETARRNMVNPQNKKTILELIAYEITHNELEKKINILLGMKYEKRQLETEIDRWDAILNPIVIPALVLPLQPLQILLESDVYMSFNLAPVAPVLDEATILKILNNIFNAARVLYDINRFMQYPAIIQLNVDNNRNNPFTSINALLVGINQLQVGPPEPLLAPLDFTKNIYQDLKTLSFILDFHPQVMKLLPSITIDEITKLALKFGDNYYKDMSKKIINEIDNEKIKETTRQRLIFSLNHNNFINKFKALETQIKWAKSYLSDSFYYEPIENFQLELNFIGRDCVSKLNCIQETLRYNYQIKTKGYQDEIDTITTLNGLSARKNKFLDDFSKGNLRDPAVSIKLLSDIKEYVDDFEATPGIKRHSPRPYVLPEQIVYKKLSDDRYIQAIPDFDSPIVKFDKAANELIDGDGNIPGIHVLLSCFNIGKLGNKKLIQEKINNFLDAISIAEAQTHLIGIPAAVDIEDQSDLDDRVSKAFEELEKIDDYLLKFAVADMRGSAQNLIKKIRVFKEEAQTKINEKTQNTNSITAYLAAGKKLLKKMLNIEETKRDLNTLTKKQVGEVNKLVTLLEKTLVPLQKRTMGLVVTLYDSSIKKNDGILDAFADTLKEEKNNFIKSISGFFGFTRRAQVAPEIVEAGLDGGTNINHKYTRKHNHNKDKHKNKKYTRATKLKLTNCLTKKCKKKQKAKKKHNSKRK
jgi:hypothetical protein